MFVILNFVAPAAEGTTQSLNQVKISELIYYISRVLQKLLKYFNGTAISTSFLLTAGGAFPVIFILHLKHSDGVILSFVSSL